MKAQTLGDTSSLEFMRGRRIFEINPDHPIIKDLNVRIVICVSPFNNN
jgi:heat shock protein beta